MKKIRILFYKMIYVVKNLIYYAPFIVKDRDWDESFIYMIIYAKLNKLERYYESGGNLPFVGWEKENKRIGLCKNLANRLWKRSYDENADLLTPKEYMIDYESRDINQKQTKQESYWIIKTMKHSTYMHQQDKKLLFKILEKHIDKWWD